MARVINLKNNERFLAQYVGLRNRYALALLTHPVTIEQTKQWINRSDIWIQGLVQGKLLLGAAVLYGNKKGEITFFARFPGKGTGIRLLNAIESKAHDAGFCSIWGWTKYGNTAARKAFEKGGFRRCGATTRTYGNRSVRGIIYRKRLAVS